MPGVLPPRSITVVPTRGSPLNPASSRVADPSRDRHPPNISPNRAQINGAPLQPLLRHQRSSNLPQISPHGTQPPSRPTTANASDSTFGRTRGTSIRISPLHIDFIIVGGGIGGLACAYALGRAGHSVRVFERARNLSQPGGGLKMPPNLTTILMEWGLGPDLEKLTTKCRGSTFHDLESGEAIGRLEWKEDVLKETGADFLLMHHADLLRVLYNLALSVGVMVTFNSLVHDLWVDDDAEKVQVKLVNGRVYDADVVIGADGYRSIVREMVLGKELNGVDSGISIYTTTIPAERMRADPELSIFPDQPEWPMWMGSSRSVLGYPIRGGREFTVHVFWPDHVVRGDDISEFVEEGWDEVCSTDIINTDECVGRIQRMISLVPYALRTKYVKRDPVEEWVHESGRVVLIGEAAHPLLPCSMHGCSLAVEDAAVFGSLFSRLRTFDQIPTLMEAFQDLRQARCQAVHLSELNNGALLWLPPGPERDGRNEGMKRMMNAGHDHWDEGMLREQWDTISEVFGYNAREAAEDWWVNWGMLRESSKSMTAWEPLALRFEVTETTSPYIGMTETTSTYVGVTS